MQQEEREHTGQQQVHKQPHKIKPRIQLAVARIGVWLILHEARVGAGVATAASGNQVGRVDGRSGIGRGPHVVRSMAVPATRRLHVAAQRTQLRVEGVAVGGELVLVAVAADRRGLHAEGRFRGLQNGVRGVAVAADRRFQIALGNGLVRERRPGSRH